MAVAAAPNTAPVYEFRCLYSHDLRKKKKLWHDGSLRYHTFNKRVMLYDESKNYIGDSHWRDAQELQEGTELKLDKGVLVDVGDRIGETQTDLAPLLEKRRLENDSSPLRPPLRPIASPAISRTGPGNPRTRPKSLSDVLGNPQGPIGRARFPTQSPYHQLHLPLGQRPYGEEPPAKKPRIGLDKENGEIVHRVEDRLEANAVAPAGRPTTSRTSALHKERKAAHARQVIDISSEYEPIRETSSQSRAAPSRKQKSPQTSKVRDDHRQPPTTSLGAPGERRKTASAVRNKLTSLKLATSKPLFASIGTPCHNPSNRSLSSTNSSKSKLRLAVHKPRKKLLYKVPLPSSKVLEPQLQTRTPRSEGRKTANQGKKSFGSIGRVRPSAGAFSELQSNGEGRDVLVGEKSSSRQLHGKKQDIDRDLAELFAESSSPLFMPESSARAATGVPVPQSLDGILSMPLGAESGSPLTPSPNRTTTPHELEDLTTHGTKASVANHALKPAPPSKVTLLDKGFMASPPKLNAAPPKPQQLPPRPRSSRRVVSENNSPKYAHNQGSAASLVRESHHADTVKESESPGQRPFKIPGKLAKLLSNTAGKSRVRQVPTTRPADDERLDDRGPWSKAEAYLLFDWFPPGRDKLAVDHVEQISAKVTVVKRGLLFDQVDAL